MFVSALEEGTTPLKCAIRVYHCTSMSASKLYVASSDDGANADSDVESDVGCFASRVPTAGRRSKVRVRLRFTLPHCIQSRSC